MLNIIKRKLEVLHPSFLEITDESELHRGHVGHHGNGVSHVKVEISSPMFEGQSTIKCHRMVQDLLREELAGSLHALSILIDHPGSSPG